MFMAVGGGAAGSCMLPTHGRQLNSMSDWTPSYSLLCAPPTTAARPDGRSPRHRSQPAAALMGSSRAPRPSCFLQSCYPGLRYSLGTYACKRRERTRDDHAGAPPPSPAILPRLPRLTRLGSARRRLHLRGQSRGQHASTAHTGHPSSGTPPASPGGGGPSAVLVDSLPVNQPRLISILVHVHHHLCTVPTLDDRSYIICIG